MSDTTKIRKKKNKLPQTIGLSFALFLITMIIGFYFSDIKAPDYLGLQPFMKSEAHFKDGSVKYFEDGAATSLYPAFLIKKSKQKNL